MYASVDEVKFLRHGFFVLLFHDTVALKKGWKWDECISPSTLPSYSGYSCSYANAIRAANAPNFVSSVDVAASFVIIYGIKLAIK